MITIDKDKCIECGACIKECPTAHLMMTKTGVKLSPMPCMECEHCVCICPEGAITMNGHSIEEYTKYKPESCDIDPQKLQNFMAMRRSVRFFTGEKLTDEEINGLLDAARYAPTAVNSHDVRFSVVKDDMDKFTDMIWDGYEKMIYEAFPDDEKAINRLNKSISDRKKDPKNDRIVFGAAAAIVVSSARMIDAIIAATYMELKAHAMGLGVLFSGYCLRSIKAYDRAHEGEETFKEWLSFGDYEPCTVLLVGHPDVKFSRAPKREELDAVFR